MFKPGCFSYATLKVRQRRSLAKKPFLEGPGDTLHLLVVKGQQRKALSHVTVRSFGGERQSVSKPPQEAHMAASH